MNYQSLTHAEAAFILFSFKRTLRDREGLTPQMVQFYESGIIVLKEKMLRLEKGQAISSPRDRYVKVPPAWPHF
jgi:hypothetical protein